MHFNVHAFLLFFQLVVIVLFAYVAEFFNEFRQRFIDRSFYLSLIFRAAGRNILLLNGRLNRLHGLSGLNRTL